MTDSDKHINITELTHVIVICVLGIIAYHNTLGAPFTFDGFSSIVENKYVKDLNCFFNLHMISHGDYGLRSRYVGYFTFALNYWFSGLNVMSYHIVNILIHITNALLLYRMIHLITKAPFFSDFTDHKSIGTLAFFASAFFVVHPIQTQAVTYIVQRFESLSTTFYLVSIIYYIKLRTNLTGRCVFCFIVSLVSSILAMKTKEIAFTIPIIIVLFEYLFITVKSKKRLFILLPIILLILLIPLTLVNGDIMRIIHSYGNAKTVKMSHYNYVITQFPVMLTYFKLLFIPTNLNLDYDYPIYKSFFQFKVLAGFITVASIITIALYLIYLSRKMVGTEKYYLRLFSFGMLWFFITLSVESGLVPLDDVIFEHRLYLPSIGFFIALFSILEAFAINKQIRIFFSEKRKEAALAILIILLCIATVERNKVWQSDVTLWEDTVKKSPDKWRCRYILSKAYTSAGRYDTAVVELEKAVRLSPNSFRSYSNHGNIYLKPL
ncbi:MAG: tetratricopeptide repeat protein [Nitrospirae bacterium]|nr:tetratricopeptide repeat protein [Nitrospirota bacterium]